MGGVGWGGGGGSAAPSGDVLASSDETGDTTKLGAALVAVEDAGAVYTGLGEGSVPDPPGTAAACGLLVPPVVAPVEVAGAAPPVDDPSAPCANADCPHKSAKSSVKNSMLFIGSSYHAYRED